MRAERAEDSEKMKRKKKKTESRASWEEAAPEILKNVF